MKLRLLPLLIAAALLAPSLANANAFERHRIQEDLLVRDVARSLGLQRNWFEASVGYNTKFSRSQFVEGGIGFADDAFEVYENDGKFVYREVHLRIRWGFSKRLTVMADFPFAIPTLKNANGADMTRFHLGDIKVGFFLELHRGLDEGRGLLRNSFGLQTTLRAPTGNESPGTFSGGPANMTNLVTGMGTIDLALQLRFKQQLAIAALLVDAGINLRFGGAVQYLIEDEYNFLSQVLDPGEQILFGAGLHLAPVDPIGVHFDVRGSYNFATRAGTPDSGIPACRACPEVAGSQGLDLSGRGTLVINPTARVELNGWFEYTLAGRPIFMWPLEELSPSRGWTAGGDVFMRF